MATRETRRVIGQVSQWGNSSAIRLPAALMKRAGITKGAEVEIAAQGTEIIIKAVTPRAKPRYKLPFTQDELIAGMTPANLRADDLFETVETEWDR